MRLLKEPLLHFLGLGAILFGLFGLLGQDDRAQPPATIVVSAARIENLATGFARIWHRPPSAEELRGLIDDYVRDEVYYREARKLGLDRDDIVIRRRLRQKLEFVAEDMAVGEPTDEQLAAYLTSNADHFSAEDRLSFTQIFLSAASRRATLERDAESVAARLANAGGGDEAAGLGDPFLLGAEFRAMPLGDVARTFGGRFAERVSSLAAGTWHGPIPSGYGLHFVRIVERTAGGLPPLDAIRPAVRREWMNARRLEAEAALYRTLREGYAVVIEPLPAQPAAGGASAGVRP